MLVGRAQCCRPMASMVSRSGRPSTRVLNRVRLLPVMARTTSLASALGTRALVGLVAAGIVGLMGASSLLSPCTADDIVRGPPGRTADSRAHDDGDCLGFSQEPIDRSFARRFEALCRHSVGFQVVHQHACRGPAIYSKPRVVRNCHLNAGQRERSLPLVGVAGMFPEYNRRSGRLYSLADRIVDCFLRSENATGAIADSEGAPASATQAPPANRCRLRRRRKSSRSPPTSRGWLAEPKSAATRRGAARTPSLRRRSCRSPSSIRERARRSSGSDAPPAMGRTDKAWPSVTRSRDRCGGPDSWNDGAGAARVYTLAGIIRYAMPYLDPGSLSDRGCPGCGGVHQLEAAAGLSVQAAGLPDGKAASRQRLLPKAVDPEP